MGKSLNGKELGTGISQRKDGYYICRYTGKTGERKSKLFKRLQEAKMWIGAQKYDEEHSDISSPINLTLDEWYKYWYKTKSRKLKQTTMNMYESLYFTHIHPIVGKIPIKNITPFHCQSIIDSMDEKNYAETTIRQVKITLHTLLQFAVSNQVLKSNPCNSGIIVFGNETKTKEALTKAEQKKFYSLIHNRSGEALFCFALQTGLRCSELCGLTWSNVNLADNELYVRKCLMYTYDSKTKKLTWHWTTPKSNAGVRTVPLTQEAKNILKEQKAKNKKITITNPEWQDLIFLTRNGGPFVNNNLNQTLHTVKTKWGGVNPPQLSMHTLRHTFATRCAESGMSAKILQTILGHSDISMTMNRYVHGTEDQKQIEMKSIEKSLLLM